jgi:hypothetical protein
VVVLRSLAEWKSAIFGRSDAGTCASRVKRAKRSGLEANAALLTQSNLGEAARAIAVASNALLKWMKLREILCILSKRRHPCLIAGVIS